MKPSFWREITTHDGMQGSFTCHNGMLTVKTPNSSNTTQIGSLPPKVLAQIMLRELAEDA